MLITPYSLQRSDYSIRLFLFLLLSILICCSPYLGAQVQFVDFVYDGEGTHFLHQPVAMDFSEDGAFAYTVSSEDNAIVVLARDAADGDLTPLAAYVDGLDDIEGLEGARDVVLSPDGKQVYVASAIEESIVVFERDSLSGLLSLARIHRNGEAGVEGLEEVTALAMSPDGEFLYAVGAAEDALLVFKRSTDTGSLTFDQALYNGEEGIEGMEYPVDIMLSPDGDFIYLTCFSANALVILDREPDDGHLTYATTFYDGSNGVDGLEGALSSILSTDGEFLYVLGKWDNTIALFGKSISKGGMSYIGISPGAIADAGGLKEPVKLGITGDGKYLLVNNGDNSSIYLFARHSLTGDLFYVTTFMDGSNGIDGLEFPVAIEESPDEKNVYVTSFGENALSIFTHELQSQDFSFYKSVEDIPNGVRKLGGISGLLLSPDGQHAYSASMDDNTVIAYQRNSSNGLLDYDQTYVDNEAGVSGLKGTRALTLSPDGNQLYVAGFYDNAIVTFTRNSSSGELTYKSKIDRTIDDINALHGPADLLLSADGQFLYVAGFWKHTILVFSRDVATGNLSYLAEVANREEGIDGLSQVSSLLLSADGNYLYATGTSDDALVVFQRNSSTGLLTFLEAHLNEEAGVAGLDGACTAAICPNGNFMYVAGINGNGIARFSRDAATGRLTFQSHIQNQVFQNDLQGIGDLMMSDAGDYLFATSKTENYLVKFSCNGSTGTLTAEELLKDDTNGINGLGGAMQLGLSPDGQFIYVAGSRDDAISVFKN